MPMFDFVCAKCGEKFEELAAASDTTTPPCPKCGAKQTERQLSCPSPLKTGAFPFKPGPVMPMGRGMPAGGCGMGGCGSGGCGSAPTGGCGGGCGCE